MSSKAAMKPLQLISPRGPAPNPWKVAMVIEELGLPWELCVLEGNFLQTVKEEPFTKFNPNGRVPAFVDPNKDNLIIWESGAIIEYLIETYDPNHTLSSSSPTAKWQERALLHFQMSGQGPYFGQAIWFIRYHPEKNPSAIERYLNEADRVTGILNEIIKQNGGTYLMGDRLSYVDLSFVPWYRSFEGVYEEYKPGFTKEKREKYPGWARWWDEVGKRESVRKFLDVMDSGDYSVLGEKTVGDLAKEIGF